MGLLDSLLSGGSGGGLLDFLRANSMNQQFPGLQASDTAQYGQPMQANAQMGIPQQPPPVIQAQPMQAPMQQPQAPQMQQAQAQQGPDFGDRLMQGFQGFAAPSAGGLFGHLAGGLAGFSGQGNLTEKALLAKGVDPVTARAAISNPELLKALVTQNFGQSPHRQEIDKDGNVWDVNLQTGQKTIALAAKDDKFQNVTTKDAYGNETLRPFNQKTGTYGEPAPGAPQQGVMGNQDLSGQAYLQSLPKQEAGIVQGMIDGTIQPPSSFALAKPIWAARLAAAKNVDPSFDANNWATRHKMSTDISASGNSSMGGILSNGKSAFKHLAEYTDSAAALGNASHDFPLGGALAHAQNAVGNTLGGSDTSAKLKAINTNLGHFGQEATKFYSGTGGGVEERMNALKEMNPTYVSSAEMAAYADKEKSLMLDRLREKESQIRDTMGEAYLQKHPVFTPELQQDLARIDANVAKLKGEKANQTKTGVSWSIVK